MPTRTRRSRFTATLQRPGIGVTRKVILAGDPASVRAFYERQGWTVLQIVKGDYRKPARAAGPVPTGGGWRLDQAALREAIAHLGLRLPVQIKQTPHRGGRRGAYSLRPTGGSVRITNGRIYNADTATALVHHITVKNWLDPEQAARTLLHELAHAMQAERVIDRQPDGARIIDLVRGWVNAAERGRGVTYMHKPIEVEAREHEALAARFKVAR